MEKYNWFPDAPNANTYWADTRMPANLVTAAFADINSIASTVPMTTLVAAWSEPPIATVGLGTGTMASYGRPYQHVHFYEIDNEVRLFSLAVPTREMLADYAKDVGVYQAYQKKKKDDSRRDTFFNYLEQCVERGSTVQVLMGDARLRMALPYKNHYQTFLKNEPDDGGGPESFYHMMVVDAFSSDAIPAHLLTKEAFLMYFDRLSPEGILCVHTSNRFVDLPKVVAAIAGNLGYAFTRGHDNDTVREEGHYTSEWVMVARKAEHLKHLSADTKFLDRYTERMGRNLKGNQVLEPYWGDVPINARYLWTDDYYNLMSVVRFGARRRDD
jgi:thiaminase